MDLQQLRTQIDKIDAQIVELYEQRMDISRQVAEYKIETGKMVFDKQREQEKLEKVKSMTHNDFNSHGIEELFEQIMSMSRKLQYQLLAENGEDAAALTVKRGSRTIELSAEPEKDEDGEYRLGAWVPDSMAGIGTMTFFDPQSGTFGALGHGVTDVDTGQLLPLDHGSIMDASVKAVKKGERASPGELKGDFDLTRDSGTLYANTECGIFGKLSAEDAAKITGAALPIAKKDEVKTGRAAILATVSGNETREYDIEIEKIYSPSGSTRNLLLRVTDEELLAQTGGVVQGMSGSAILQDGKIIGAVTHVLLDDPSRGYGIFIENMLSAAGLSSE